MEQENNLCVGYEDGKGYSSELNLVSEHKQHTQHQQLEEHQHIHEPVMPEPSPEPQRGRRAVQLLRFLLPYLMLLIAYLVYLVIGGLLFSWLESPFYSNLSAEEHAKMEEAQHTKQFILEAYQNASMGTAKLEDDYITALLDSLIDTVDHPDWKAGRMKTLMIGRDWSFPSAMLFAMTTITTIGYGDLVPETLTGKVVCVVYSMIGVPFSFFLLANIGQLLAFACIRVVRYFKDCCRKPTSENSKAREADVSKSQATTPKMKRKTNRGTTRQGLPNVTMRHLQSLHFQVDQDGNPVAERRTTPRNTPRNTPRSTPKSTPQNTPPSSPKASRKECNLKVIELDELRSSLENTTSLNTNNSGLDQTNPASCQETTFNTVTSTAEEKKEPIYNNGTKVKKQDSLKSDNDDELENEYHADEVSMFFVLCILGIYFSLSAFAFTLVEGWDFGTAFYFVFITLTTIGFGDVVPEEQYSEKRFFFCLLFTVFGLAVTSMCIALAQDRVSRAGKTLMGYLSSRVRSRDEEENSTENT